MAAVCNRGDALMYATEYSQATEWRACLLNEHDACIAFLFSVEPYENV